jgi:hypothetical protein
LVLINAEGNIPINMDDFGVAPFKKRIKPNPPLPRPVDFSIYHDLPGIADLSKGIRIAEKCQGNCGY